MLKIFTTTFVAITSLCMVSIAQDTDLNKANQDGNKKNADGNSGWVSMFNGRTLAGWTQKNGWATYEVQPATGDNPAAIVGTTAEGSPNSFLCSVRRYGDFELEFEVKVSDELNSGVQIRSQTKQAPGKSIYNTGRVNGPQVEIEASGTNGAESGYIYGESCGGWMTPDKLRLPHKHFKDGEWNAYRILTSGPNIKVWVNGAMVSDLTDEEKFKTHPRGFIGLQVHGIGKNPGPYTAAWRNVRIREPKTQKADRKNAGLVDARRLIADAKKSYRAGHTNPRGKNGQEPSEARAKFEAAMKKLEEVLIANPELIDENMITEAMVTTMYWRKTYQLNGLEVPVEFPLSEIWVANQDKMEDVVDEFQKENRRYSDEFRLKSQRR